MPRAGTLSPLQVYEAQIVMNSKLPWAKEVVHNWRWSFRVWASICPYTTLLLALLCCCKTLVLPSGPATGVSSTGHDGESKIDVKKGDDGVRREEARVGGRWRRGCGVVEEVAAEQREEEGQVFSQVRGEGEGEGSSAASSRNVTREDEVWDS